MIPGRMTELPSEMSEVLIRLALTSNGATAKMDSDRGGGSARHYDDVMLAGILGRRDGAHEYAPAEHYAKLFDAAQDEEERARVLEAARDELDRILHSKGDPTAVETLDQLFDRIIEHGEGWPRRDVAVWAKTSEAVVARARRERGRDEDYGRPAEDATGLDREERRRRARGLAEQGMGPKAIAFALTVPYSTVLRDLGRKA